MSETPLMTQYKEIKNRYEDCVLFFRLGDFYEMFFQDAHIVSKELGLTLTSRNKEKNQEVPLAGIPYHTANPYIGKLINKGYKVAICEQIENPKDAKGIVKRDVIRVITPGTVIDPEYLDEKSNNYLLGIKIEEEKMNISYIDITTGEFITGDLPKEHLYSEINKIAPKEIVVDEKTYEFLENEKKGQFMLNDILLSKVDIVKKPKEYLEEYFSVKDLSAFGLGSSDKEGAIEVAALVLSYVIKLQKGNPLPIKKIMYKTQEEVVELNVTTQRNLDLFKNGKDGTIHGTLFWVLDQCNSSMGSRLLKNYIKNPLKSKDKIEKRYYDVEYFMKNALLREETRNFLKEIYDIERILGKLFLETENGKDINALKKSVEHGLNLVNILGRERQFITVSTEILEKIYMKINNTLKENPPFTIREGGLIKEGYNSELDELHEISTRGKDYILAIEARERENTGIKNLKIKYNKVFGYFIEITNSNKNSVPSNYIRKQTLSNAERYIVPDLKEYEEKVLHAKERIESLEYGLFKELTKDIREYGEILQQMAKEVAYVDVITTFAHNAIKNNYIKPELEQGYQLELKGGRHPVVEKLLGRNEFVKNDLFLDEEKNIMILTGPNMAGKSTYMKQVALILIMAHIGCYIPADYGKIPIVDKIFTRVGASDDLITGQSTFMLEMSEMAGILNSATEKSFIILDEIGRGTSTYDGISIATAITEYIHNKVGAKTIFATHYHELTQLEVELPKVCNYRIEVKEEEEKISFLRKIVCGGADKSYGIEVARVAGLPKGVLNRAKTLLQLLESQREIVNKKMEGEQLNLFSSIFETSRNESKDSNIEEDKIEIQGNKKELEILKKSIEDRDAIKKEKIIIEKLVEINVETLTPIEAFLKLNELKNILG